MEARPVTVEDLPAVLQLVAARPYSGSAVPGVTAERRLQSTLTQLRQHGPALMGSPRLSFDRVKEPPAFWLTVHNHEDHATGQKESVILEHAGEVAAYPALWQSCAGRARQRRDEFVAVRVFPGDSAEPFASLGFRPEFRRVVRPLSAATRAADYSIRRATPDDRVFLTRLTLESASFYRSANRSGIPALAWNDMANYLSLDLTDTSELLGWVAELDQERVGYVLVRRRFPVELLEQEAAYLYDIAVRPEHWGRGAASQLHEHAVNELFALGIVALVGDISAENPRAYQIAVGKLGYVPEWERWGCNL